MTLDEINDLRYQAEMDELTHAELLVKRIRIKGPIPPPPSMGATYYEYDSVINRRRGGQI